MIAVNKHSGFSMLEVLISIVISPSVLLVQLGCKLALSKTPGSANNRFRAASLATAMADSLRPTGARQLRAVRTLLRRSPLALAAMRPFNRSSAGKTKLRVNYPKAKAASRLTPTGSARLSQSSGTTRGAIRADVATVSLGDSPMNTVRTRRNSGGFTLVELMVAMVLALLILAAIGGLYVSANRHSECKTIRRALMKFSVPLRRTCPAKFARLDILGVFAGSR